MGILEKISNSMVKAREVALAGFTSTVARTDNAKVDVRLPVHPGWMLNPIFGQPRRANVMELRQFAQSSWVQMVLNTIKKEVTNTQFEIVNDDEDDTNSYDNEKKLILDFFDNINSNHETIYDMMMAAITDVGEIDAGIWVKVFGEESYQIKEVQFVDQLGNDKGTGEKRMLKQPGQRQLKELWYGDGGTFLKQTDPYRRLLAYFQYSFKMPKQQPKEFFPDEVVYMMLNRRSYSIYGFSPLQSVQQVVELLIQSTRWNKDYFKNNLIPDAIIGLPGVDPNTLKAFQKGWERQVKAKAHKTTFVNSDLSVQQLNTTGKDMEFLDGQKWFMHNVFGVYGLSPTEAGFHENVNQGNQAGQERITVRNAIKPYLNMFERSINKQVLADILGIEKSPVKLKFIVHEQAEEQIQFENNMKEIVAGTLTINEYRQERGRDPVEWGETPTTQSDESFGNDDDDDGDNDDNGSNNANNNDNRSNGSNNSSPPNNANPKGKGSKKEESKSITKNADEIEAGEDVVEESEDYSQFYEKIVDGWEVKVLNALEHAPLTKSGYVNKIKGDAFVKTFGEFIRDVMNAINTTPFMKQLHRIVKRDMMAGLDSAEEEVGIQIGAGPVFNDKVKALVNQQLDGYTINGKKWHGIKGATRELQLKILKTVESNVRDKVPMKETVADIQNIFDGATTSQAKRIARTETTRFINEGKLSGYKDSGIEGRKAWSIVGDDRTSDIDVRLHKKYGDEGIEFDDVFIDDITGKSFNYPPSHPNCRCVIEYRSKK